MSQNLEFDKFYNIIDGEKRGADKTRRGINPATKEELWEVPCATEQDVNDAVAAAQRAFKSYSRLPISERSKLLLKLADLWEPLEQQFTKLLTTENGKPLGPAAHEVGIVKAHLRHHAGLTLPEERFEDETRIATTRYTPLGVVAAICPWNYPLTLSIGKIAPALISGCTIIVKPSPFTPYTALKLVELAQQVFPPGVVQAVGGSDDIGPLLVEHPGIAKISFTGSIATGKRIIQAAAKTLKRVTLELGGNDPCIVFPDVDIAKTAPEVALAAFNNTSQICVATKRIYVHADIYEPFLKALSEATRALTVGDGAAEGVQLGPIQNAMQYDKVKEFFADSAAQGHKFAVGGPDVPDSKGYFIQPAIIDNPPSSSRIVTEEPFGPIVPVQPWTDLEEVIARANDTNAGLGATVWIKDVAKGEEVAQRLEAGNVFINSSVKPTPEVFFSGHKESGVGGEWGTRGVLAYCNAHATHVWKQ